MALNQNLQKLKTLVSLHDEAKEGKKYASKQEWVLDTLNQIVSILDQGLTKKEFTTAFKALNDYVKKAKEVISESNKNEIERLSRDLRNTLDNAINESDDTRNGTLNSLKKNMDELMSSIRFSHEAMLSEAQAKLDEVHNGEDADEEVIVQKVLSLIPPKPDETPESTRDRLETLKGEERLDASAIKNLPEMVATETAPFRAGIRGVEVYDEGITRGLVKIINFTGAGVSTSRLGEQVIVSISGGGAGSTTPSQESGTIADLTTIITLAETPVSGTLMLYINEGFIDPNRYSLTGAGKTITMGSALDSSYTGLRFTAIYQY